MSVPHVFEGRPQPASFSGGVGWYRLRFRNPPKIKHYPSVAVLIDGQLFADYVIGNVIGLPRGTNRSLV